MTTTEAIRVLVGNRYAVSKELVDPISLRKELSIHVEDHMGNHRSIELYDVGGPDLILVPRLYGIEHYGRPDQTHMTDGEMIDPRRLEDVRFKLYEAQEKCVHALRTRFFAKDQCDEGRAGCVLNLACGKGKTHIGIQRIADVGRRALVICHSNVSVSQWRKNIQRSLPLLTVAEFHGGSGGKGGDGCFPEADVIVSTIHPLAVMRYREKYDGKAFMAWLLKFGHVIYDEIHIFGAPAFSDIFNILRCRIQFGLSATPDRIDGMEKMFELKVGPILDAKVELDIAPPTFEVTVIPIQPASTASRARPSTEQREGSYAELVKTITMLPDRVSLLVQILRVHFGMHPLDNMLIFCNFIEEVNFLFDPLATAFPDKTIGKIYEDKGADEIALLADTAHILICTYKKGGTAFSPIRFRSVTIWSPTRAMITQAIGRIQRWRDEEGMELGPEGSWNELPRTIYDFADQNTVASMQYSCGSRENGHLIPGRKAIYVASGFRIIGKERAVDTSQLVRDSNAAFKKLGF